MQRERERDECTDHLLQTWYLYSGDHKFNSKISFSKNRTKNNSFLTIHGLEKIIIKKNGSSRQIFNNFFKTEFLLKLYF